jgi:hypothetical protein
MAQVYQPPCTILHYGPPAPFPQPFFRTGYGVRFAGVWDGRNIECPWIHTFHAYGVIGPDFLGVNYMKPTLICTAVALAVLWAGSITLAKNATGQKPATTQKQAAEVKEAGKTLTPQQKRLETLQKSHESEMTPWKEVLKIAEEEKATKTIAAINKVIAAKEEAYKKSLAQLEKRTAAQENAANGKANTTDATKSVSKPAEKK